MAKLKATIAYPRAEIYVALHEERQTCGKDWREIQLNDSNVNLRAASGRRENVGSISLLFSERARLKLIANTTFNSGRGNNFALNTHFTKTELRSHNI